MKTVKKIVIPLKDKVTKEEVLENIKQNDGVCYLQLECDWEGVCSDLLNDVLDETVERGWHLCDVTYTPIKIKDGMIIFEACAADCEEFIAEWNGEESEE